MTQDLLAAKVGVTQNTIARLEGGTRRPSLDLLERLARVLECRVYDLIPEEKEHVGTQQEPILRGAPMSFRAAVQSAQRRRKGEFQLAFYEFPKVLYRYQCDYWCPGEVLGSQLSEYLDEGALSQLMQMAKEPAPQHFFNRFSEFLDREFPGCMVLIPKDRRVDFIYVVLRSIAGYRNAYDIAYSFKGMEDWKKEEVKRYNWSWTKAERFPKAFVQAVRECLEWLEKSGKATRWILRGTVQQDSTKATS